MRRSAYLLSVLLLVGCSPSLVKAEILMMADLNTEQIGALDRKRTVVLLTGGILEQHGPYLPSFSDGYQNEYVTKRLADAIASRPGWNAVVFPTIPLGTGGANEIGGRFHFAGTYAVRSTTLQAVFMDLATDLGEQRFRWIFVIHGHGAPNHNRALDRAGDYFDTVYGGRMVHLLGRRLAPGSSAEEVYPEAVAERAGLDVHAGTSETSRLLFLRPDLVAERRKTAEPLRGGSWEDLRRIAQADDWPGYLSDPAVADARYGEVMLRRRTERVVEMALKILDGLDPATIARRHEVARSNPENLGIDRAALAREREISRAQARWLPNPGDLAPR